MAETMQTSTPNRPSCPLLEERNTPPKSEVNSKEDNVMDRNKEKIPEITKESIFKNIGFVNRKWTEIMVEGECEQLEREEVSRTLYNNITESDIQNPNVKVNVDVKIINVSTW